MPITGFDTDRCQKRNSLAARRQGVNATPVRFLRGNPTAADASEPAVVWARGTLPKDDAAALERINASLPAGSAPLTPEQVYIHYIEAANGSFIADRFMFLSASTLKNIARDAESGFAFMNSHRTGGLSHPSELPFGRTFAGRYEVSQAEGSEDKTARTVVGFYMLAGQKPNGESGPSTDALNAGIRGGTIFDVSVGLWGGTQVCDVCGEDLMATNPDWETWDEYYLCPHVPGTHHAMTEEDIARQTERGVPDGLASYSLADARCGEVSAVFDGAVPGAGFQKALAFSRHKGAFGAKDAAQFQSSYSALLRGKSRNKEHLMPNIDPEELREEVQGALTRALRSIGLGRGNRNTSAFSHDDDIDIDPGNPPPSAHQLGTALQAAVAERDRLKAENETLKADNERLSAYREGKVTAAREKAASAAVTAFGQGDPRIEQVKLAAAGMNDPDAIEAYAETLTAQAPAAFRNATGQRQTAAAALPSGEEGTPGEVSAEQKEERTKIGSRVQSMAAARNGVTAESKGGAS